MRIGFHNIKSANFNSNNTNKNTNPFYKTKMVENSALDIHGEYGKAMVAMSFGENRDISDREFQIRKNKIEKTLTDKGVTGITLIDILDFVNKDNLKLAELLCYDKDIEYPAEQMNYLFCEARKHNVNLAMRLFCDKELDFPKDKIYDVLYKTNVIEDSTEFITRLCCDKKTGIPRKHVPIILNKTNDTNKDLAKALCFDKKLNASGDLIVNILQLANKDNADRITGLVEICKQKEISAEFIPSLINNKVSYEDINALSRTMGKKMSALKSDDFPVACKFSTLYNKQNINEIPISEKRGLLRKLVSFNFDLFGISKNLKKYFPLIPVNQHEYCTLLPSLVKSIGIETKKLDDEQINKFNTLINTLSDALSGLSDEEFNNLEIRQEYSKEEFIQDTFNTVKDLSKNERQKVYDYFGFELHHKGKTAKDGFYISGYPVNLNNGEKLTEITDDKTKDVIEKLRPIVVRFSENNRVISNNKTIEDSLNTILDYFPELRTSIGKSQHSTHKFDVFKHSLKVMQKAAQNEEFNKLNNSDKKILLLSSLFHDINKQEGEISKSHAFESAFDTYYIVKKLNLSKEEETKLYSLIKTHKWLDYVNSKNDKDRIIRRQKSVAFDMQYDNLFDMAKIFTQADLKAVKDNDDFYNKYEDNFKNHTEKIEQYIKELKTTRPLLPVTQIPKASIINRAITTVNSDYSTNIKGVYKDENGLIIIKYNEVENEDWEKIGFPKNSASKGIKATGVKKTRGHTKEKEIETGNIKFFAHGLDYENQLAKFDVFALPDSDALLSVSYAERPESKYRFFRTQGVLLNADAKYIHGGGNTDMGSGCGKNINNFKKDYAYKGSVRHKDRTYVSNLIKMALKLDDEEYVKFVEENKNKPITEIGSKDTQEKLVRAYASINSNTRRGDRNYNEMYLSNPDVMGVFAYDAHNRIMEIKDFMKRQKSFLKQYAIDNDVPFVVFGK